MASFVGDLSLRVRSGKPGNSGGDWSLYSTIALSADAEPIELDSAAAGAHVLAAQDITNLLNTSLPDGPSLPVRVVRSYERSADGAALVLRFNLTCTSTAPIEIGGLGMALPESPGHPPAGIETVVWSDPHVGGAHGFVEFVRVVEDEATLLVAAEEAHTSGLEAWRPMLEDLGGGDAYEWLVASKAWADEWATNRQFPFVQMSDALKRTYPAFGVHPPTPWPATNGKVAMPVLAQDGGGAAQPWNPPTSITLAPAESRSVSLRLQLAAGGPRTRDAALEEMGHPIVHAIPGYVLHTDLAHAFLKVKPPPGTAVVSAAADPPIAPYTATITLRQRAEEGATASSSPSPTSSSSGFVTFGVVAKGYGRARVTITFSDGTEASCHYFVTPPFASQVQSLGSFLADTAWLPRDFVDPFGRSASVMPWDRSMCDGGTGGAPTPCGHVLNDARAYDVGLSDDAGGGNPLCMASKVRAMPNAHEASRIDEYIEFTLYGIKPDTAKPPYKSLQIREEEVASGLARAADVDGIRMTLFYYDAELSNHTSGHFAWEYTEADKCHKPFGAPTWCMTEDMANATYRGFNYPHQIASYWAMYHVARHTSLGTRRPWHWYLHRAGRTALKLGTAQVGFMDGTVVREVLDALQTEGAAGNATMASLARALGENMRARQRHWASTPYPYGSEFGFDTTGQEEVVVWSLYFGDEGVAKRTVDHILSYMRSSPTWAYHGGARSWGDVGNNGKYLATYGTGVADRGQMHYRAGLNMIPLVEWYRRHPEEGLLLLEISMGALGGQMTNIHPVTGAPSMMFHAAAHVMEHDPHSGDYGLGFFGNALQSGSYYVEDGPLGPLCYLCDLEPGTAGVVRFTPRDAYAIAVFLEPLGLYMTSECGQIVKVELPGRQGRFSNRGGGGRARGGGDGSLSVTFGAAAACDKFRLKLTKTAHARPGSGFAVANAPVVRGAYEIVPEPGNGTTVVTVTYGT